jgi:short-subunit dehydrogenase
VDSWRSILELNVLALSVCTKEAIESMKERAVDDGHIIHMNRLARLANLIRSLCLDMFRLSSW